MTVRRALGVLFLLAFGLGGPGAASAANITVNSSSDAVSGAGPCTLREAVIAANTDTATGGCVAGSGADVITVGVPKVTLSIPGAAENFSSTGDLDASSVITIAGAGAGSTVVDGGGLDRVLDVHAGATVTVQDLTITGGRAPAGADDSVFVTPPNGTVRGRDGAPGAPGGGVANDGTLTLLRVTIMGNHTGRGGSGGSVTGADGTANFEAGQAAGGGSGGAGGGGGGVYNAGALTLEDSTLTGNVTGAGGSGAVGTGGDGGPIGAGGTGLGGAGGDGGPGAGLASTGPATVTGTDISGNTAGAGGAGAVGSGGGGGAGNCPCDGGGGGAGDGGGGGRGGPGGGIATLGNAVTLDDSLVRSNATGPGGAAGAGEGGGGHNGVQGGNGGPGGAGTGGAGGPGGNGGGLAANQGVLVSDSETITANTAAGGGEGGIGAGGPAGNGGFASDGGAGRGGIGGGAGAGGGVSGLSGATVTQATVANNHASASGGTGGTALGGFGGTGSTHNGADGAHTSGAAGSNGTAGGVFFASVRDSILVANVPDSCGLTGGANDVEFPGTSCSGALHADPNLGPLADNGGLTLTYALSPGSPAVDLVPTAGAGCVATDQRGVPRPQGAACDAGAYELAPPAVATGTAVPGTTTADVTGTVNPHFRAASAHFEYGLTSAYGSVTADQDAGAGNVDVTMLATLTGLSPGTTYHVRLVAANVDGAAQGGDVTFTTSTVTQPPPVTPALSKLTLTPGTFRVAPVKHPRRRGTEISYRDTAAASTTFAVEQRRAGVRKGKLCVAPPRTHRRKKRTPCTRYVRLKGTFSHADQAGANKLRFTGVLGRTRLSHGSYRLLARPRAGTVVGALVRKAFGVR